MYLNISRKIIGYRFSGDFFKRYRIVSEKVTTYKFQFRKYKTDSLFPLETPTHRINNSSESEIGTVVFVSCILLAPSIYMMVAPEYYMYKNNKILQKNQAM